MKKSRWPASLLPAIGTNVWPSDAVVVHHHPGAPWYNLELPGAHSSSLVHTVSFSYSTHEASKAVPASAGGVSGNVPAGGSAASKTA